MRFLVDVYNAAGAKQSGRTAEVWGVKRTIRASAIGEMTFTLALATAKAEGFAFGAWYEVRREGFGVIGKFKHIKHNDSAANKTRTIVCADEITKLKSANVGFNWTFRDATVTGGGGVVAQVVNDAGMTASFDNSTSEFNVFSGDFHGDSAFDALSMLMVKHQRGYFALGGVGVVACGRFTDTQLAAATPAFNLTQANLVEVVEERDYSGLCNRLILKGAGQGVAQVDLSKSDLLSITPAVQSALNHDGVSYRYYIEDAASIAAYGLEERLEEYDIRPITPSVEDQKNASRELHRAGVARLAQISQPANLINWQVDCVNIPHDTRPGQVVLIDYHGVGLVRDRDTRQLTNVPDMTINKVRAFVVDVDMTFDNDTGAVVGKLLLAINGERLPSFMGAISRSVKKLDEIGVRIQPSVAVYPSVTFRQEIDAANPFEFDFPIPEYTLAINDLWLEWTQKPFVDTLIGGEASGGQSITSGASSTTTTGVAGDVNNQEFETGQAFVLTPHGLDGALPTSFNSSGSLSTNPTQHTHNIYMDRHGHFYYLPEHAHNHDHTHTVVTANHTHAPIRGIYKDSQTPTGLKIYFKNQAGAWVQITAIYDRPGGTLQSGSTVSGETRRAVNLRDSVLALNEWHGDRSIKITCTSGQGNITAWVSGRITIQPALG